MQKRSICIAIQRVETKRNRELKIDLIRDERSSEGDRDYPKLEVFGQMAIKMFLQSSFLITFCRTCSGWELLVGR